MIHCESFPPALTDGLSLESEWQQAALGLQDSSQYYGWSNTSLDGLGSTNKFPTLPAP